jgi:hypothetical protein
MDYGASSGEKTASKKEVRSKIHQNRAALTPWASTISEW